MKQLKFDWNEFKECKYKGTKNEIGILCKTKEESKLFCRMAEERGITWVDGDSLVKKGGEDVMNGSVFSGENPGIIYFQGVLVGACHTYAIPTSHNYDIIPLQEILKENKFEVELL